MLTEINENSASKTMWAKISNGLIVITADESDPKAKSRINKVGNTVYERFYKSIYGIITSISVEENKFGETEVRVGIKHKEQNAVLTFNLDSSYGRGFLSQILNVDLKRGIDFCPWQKVLEDGTKRSNLYLNYGKNQPVENKLPEGCPVVKWVQTLKGSVIDPVSKAEHDDFLDKRLAEFIKSNNLVYSNGLSSISDEEFNEMTQPLSAAEQAELKSMKSVNKEPKKNNQKTKATNMEDDDFFRDL
jgi:hypothetical protein